MAVQISRRGRWEDKNRERFLRTEDGIWIQFQVSTYIKIYMSII